jgi:hypothetical protein
VHRQFFDGLEYWNSIAHQDLDNGFVIFSGTAQQMPGYRNLVSWQTIDTVFEEHKNT